MSSIRLYLLSALADGGEMHGHQLKQLAEKEHIDMWTDITPGGLYGALKRLAAEELITEVRTEQIGAYPERQVWAVTDAGREALDIHRRSGLSEIAVHSDPVDLALARLDRRGLEEVPSLLAERLGNLRAMLTESETHAARIAQYLTPMELMVMRHRAVRLRAEISWHEELLTQLPALLADEESRKDELRD